MTTWACHWCLRWGRGAESLTGLSLNLRDLMLSLGRQFRIDVIAWWYGKSRTLELVSKCKSVSGCNREGPSLSKGARNQDEGKPESSVPCAPPAFSLAGACYTELGRQEKCQPRPAWV